jgi:hypothetical protein
MMKKSLILGIFLLIAACQGGVTPGSPGVSGGTSGAGSYTGVVIGGNSPIEGSTVTLYKAGQGVSATPLGSGTTDSSGEFTINYSGGLSTDTFYLEADGGTPQGTSSSNSAIKLFAAVGAGNGFQSLGELYTINELTTAALAQAAHQFWNPGTLTGFANISGNPTNALTAAVNTALAMVKNDGSFTTNAQASAGPALNAIADMLAACVQSGSDTSSECQTLLTYNGSTLTDTVSAAISIVSGVGNLPPFSLIGATPPFDTPAPLASTGGDGADNLLGTTIVYSGFSDPYLAVDGANNVYVIDRTNNTLTEIPSAGNPTSYSLSAQGCGVYGYMYNSLGVEPVSNNVFFIDSSCSGVQKLVEFSSSGGVTFPAVTLPAGAASLSLDTAGNFWIPITGSTLVDEILKGDTSVSSSVSFSSCDTGGGVPLVSFDSSDNMYIGINMGVTGTEYVAEIPNGSSSVSVCKSLGSYQNAENYLPIGAAGGDIVIPTTTGVFYNVTANGLSTQDYIGSVTFDGAGDWLLLQSSGNSTGQNRFVEYTEYSPYTPFFAASPALSTSNVLSSNSRGSIVVDNAGNVWIVNIESGTNTSSVVEFVGVAVPTQNPLP